MNGLRIELLSAKVGSFEVTVPRLQVLPGQVTCLIGRSGAGKTTVLNAIAGFLPLVHGSVSFDCEDLTGLPPERRRIAMVFQKGALFPHLTVGANVEYALRLQGKPPKEREAQARSWLDRFGIPELYPRLPHEISVGQAQRVGMARALAAGFPTVLLDEPFSALDPTTRGEIRTVFRNAVRESRLCAVLVSHYLEDLKDLADEAICLSEGKVLWAGDPKAMDLEDPRVRRALFG